MNQAASSHPMLAEIVSQTDAWQETIDLARQKEERLRELFSEADEVVFTGCGSGLNAGMAIAPVFQHIAGIRARAVPAAEIVFFPETVFVPQGKTVLVPISRSGATTEVVRARDLARSQGIPTLSITCYPKSPLAVGSTESVILEAANEESVTTTRSLTSMVLCGQFLGGVVAGDAGYLGQLSQLPVIGRRIIQAYQGLGRAIAEESSITRFAFVGQGPFIGLAREGQLKIKEMVLLPSDSYPLLDYRHGPKSNVDEHMLVTVLMSDRAHDVEIEFLAEIRSLGGQILAICDRAGADVRVHADHIVQVESGLSEFARGVLYMPPIQFMAFYKSLNLGLDPARPRNLSYWVATSSMES